MRTFYFNAMIAVIWRISRLLYFDIFDIISIEKEGKMQDNITMVCQQCKNENYITKKNKSNTPDRLEIKKYCSRCDQSTIHKEKKK